MGRKARPLRLLVFLLVDRWVEDSAWQVFYSFTDLQHESPTYSRSMSRWRTRSGCLVSDARSRYAGANPVVVSRAEHLRW